MTSRLAPPAGLGPGQRSKPWTRALRQAVLEMSLDRDAATCRTELLRHRAEAAGKLQHSNAGRGAQPRPLDRSNCRLQHPAPQKAAARTLTSRVPVERSDRVRGTGT